MKKALQLFGIIALAVVMAFSMTGCKSDLPEEGGSSMTPPNFVDIEDEIVEPVPVFVTGVSLNTTSTTILVGGTETLSANIEPANATNKNVTWSSNNDTVATVSANGTVTAHTVGTAVITVITEDGNKTASCNVTVSAVNVNVTGVSLDEISVSIPANGFKTLTATIAPANATNRSVTWTSSDSTVATVEGGFVTAKKVGIATITVRTVDGGFAKSCTVKVTPPVFTSISEMAVYIYALPNNTAASPYAIKLNVNALPSGDVSNYSNLQNALRINNKYVNLDLSDSTFTSIGERAFYNCTNLISVTIPNSVTSIGDWAFCYCRNLTSVTIGNSVTSIGEKAFGYCGLTSVTIPDSVTSIGDGAFSSILLTSVTIGNSVTSIGKNAFSVCSFTSVTIPNSVISIGDGAFSDCISLTSVTIGNSVTSIGVRAFYACSLTSVTIPNSVTSIGKEAFYFCESLTSVTIGNSVTSIGDGAFSDCFKLTNVTIGSSVTSIGYDAFAGSYSLTSVTIPNSVISIGDYAFSSCSSLTNVTIGNSVTSIGERAFLHCVKLTNVTIGNSVTSIGDYAFSSCPFTSVTIPASVTSIGDGAFLTGLTSVTFNGIISASNFSAGAFFGDLRTKYLAVGIGTYKTTAPASSSAVWNKQ